MSVWNSFGMIRNLSFLIIKKNTSVKHLQVTSSVDSNQKKKTLVSEKVSCYIYIGQLHKTWSLKPWNDYKTLKTIMNSTRNFLICGEDSIFFQWWKVCENVFITPDRWLPWGSLLFHCPFAVKFLSCRENFKKWFMWQAWLWEVHDL